MHNWFFLLNNLDQVNGLYDPYGSPGIQYQYYLDGPSLTLLGGSEVNTDHFDSKIEVCSCTAVSHLLEQLGDLIR